MFRKVLGDKGLCDLTSSFGSVDGLAGVYFDLWATAGDISNGGIEGIDFNGAFERTCGQERHTSYYGRAGKRRTCIDCFGYDCSQRTAVNFRIK